MLFVEPDLVHSIYRDAEQDRAGGMAVGSDCRPIGQDGGSGKVTGQGFAWHLDAAHSELDAARASVTFTDPRTTIAHLDTGWSQHETVPAFLDRAAAAQLRGPGRSAGQRPGPRQRGVPDRQLRPRHRHARASSPGRRSPPRTGARRRARRSRGADPHRRPGDPAQDQLARPGDPVRQRHPLRGRQLEHGRRPVEGVGGGRRRRVRARPVPRRRGRQPLRRAAAADDGVPGALRPGGRRDRMRWPTAHRTRTSPAPRWRAASVPTARWARRSPPTARTSRGRSSVVRRSAGSTGRAPRRPRRRSPPRPRCGSRSTRASCPTTGAASRRFAMRCSPAPGAGEPRAGSATASSRRTGRSRSRPTSSARRAAGPSTAGRSCGC